MIGSLMGVSIPIYWLGLMEMMLFAVVLNWLPWRPPRSDIELEW